MSQHAQRPMWLELKTLLPFGLPSNGECCNLLFHRLKLGLKGYQLAGSTRCSSLLPVDFWLLAVARDVTLFATVPALPLDLPVACRSNTLALPSPLPKCLRAFLITGEKVLVHGQGNSLYFGERGDVMGSDGKFVLDFGGKSCTVSFSFVIVRERGPCCQSIELRGEVLDSANMS